MFPMGTLLFQVSQPYGPSKHMSVGIDTIKHFLGKRGEKDSFMKKSESQHENTTSSESSVNKAMETMMTGENDPSIQDPVNNVTNADGLIKLFDQ